MQSIKKVKVEKKEKKREGKKQISKIS